MFQKDYNFSKKVKNRYDYVINIITKMMQSLIKKRQKGQFKYYKIVWITSPKMNELKKNKNLLK